MLKELNTNGIFLTKQKKHTSVHYFANVPFSISIFNVPFHLVYEFFRFIVNDCVGVIFRKVNQNVMRRHSSKLNLILIYIK